MSEQWVHERVTARARDTPDATAIIDRGERWSYRRLVDRAGRVAHGLRAAGVGPEDVVAVALERSAEMVAVALGAWTAGAAVVVVDRHQPPRRLARMFGGCAVAVGLTTGTPPELPAVRRWLDPADLPAAGPDVPPGDVRSCSAAYVVFTSGSTGEPKGIVGTHGALANYLDDLAARGYLEPQDVVVPLAGISYDASLRDMFFPLTVGATVVLEPTAGRDLPTTLALLRDTPASAVLAIVPSMLRELVHHAERTGTTLPDVRRVLVSGERLHHADVAAARAVLPAARLANLYGPSEATIISTVYDLPDQAIGAEVPIGRPIANATLHVLDRALAPVPRGLPGDLYIAGAGLTRGYWHRPGATAQAFLPNPFVSGARMYRTGDRARWRPDGLLEFLGRTDDQVKIRGQRVELGEVEVALRELPSVREAACVVSEDSNDQPMIVAYLTLDGDPTPDLPGRLRQQLATMLPDAFVPATLVPLAAMPRTVGGKIDRGALAAQAPLPTGVPAEGTAPLTPTEKTLVEVWSEVLGAPVTGIEHDFFQIGGHSLLAMQLTARLNEIFQITVPLLTVFEAPTIAELAVRVDALLAAAQPTASDGTTDPVRPAGPDESRPSRPTPAQRRIWEIARRFGDGPELHVVGTFRLTGPLEVAALARALTGIVDRHDALHTTFPVVDGAPQPRVVALPPVTLPVEDLSQPAADRDGRLRRLLAAVVDEPFVLDSGPLWRAGLVRLGPQEHLLHVVVHHIIADGWSMGNLYRELVTRYDAQVRGVTADLPAPTEQYSEYATRQAERAAAGTWDTQVTYWRDRLHPTARLIDLADGYPFRDRTDRRVHRRQVDLDAATTRRLADTASARRCTPAMLLLAAFVSALSEVFGQERFQVAMPVAGRTDRQLEPMIGLLANTVLLPFDLSGSPAFDALLDTVRGTMLDGYGHSDAPLESVLAGLAPDAVIPELQLAQALFNVQEGADGAVRAAGVEVTAEDLTEARPRFPVALYVDSGRDTLRLRLACDAGLFDDAWADMFVAVLCRPLGPLSGRENRMVDVIEEGQ